MDHLVTAYDPTWFAIFKYCSMLLSAVGIFKTNFVTTTFFSAPLGYSAADYALTDSLIQGMESIRDGYHSFATQTNLATTFVPDLTMKSVSYASQFAFSMFTGSLFVQATILALVCKYMTTAIMLGQPLASIGSSLLNMVVIGMLPDVLVTTLPLYFNYRRLYDL